MDRGTYIAASGGLYQIRRLDTVANNLANVSTSGFKKQILSGETQSFAETFAATVTESDPFAAGDQERTTPVSHLDSQTDFSPGSISRTGNPLNVALRGNNQFFSINTPNGVRYTRAGDFTLAADGRIVTPDGYELVGDGGPIVTTGADTSISPSGQVTSGGVIVGAIQVVAVNDLKELTPEGSARFALSAKGSTTPVEPDLMTESLEGSNISVVSGMVELIAAHRGFEAYTKMAQSIDQMNSEAITQLSKMR